ncbi:MAG: copper chaperone PCu(A)C [Caulobacteraceae bacterium]|nr:copper chaperone PCu(A)C [Caulobacteraceae bacterium]
MRQILALSAITLAIAACSQPTAEPEAVPETTPAQVSATDAWCRPTAQGAGAAGCYVTLTATADDRLTGAASPAGERVEIHTMSMDGGVMRMRELPDGLALPAGQAVALTPGAEHLMLMAPTAALNEGETVEITLSFQSAPAQTVTAQIKSAPHGMAH